MTRSLSWMRQRLSQRGDSEHGQALIRIAVLLVVLAYLLVRGAGGTLDAAAYSDVLGLVFTGLVVGVALIGWIIADPRASHLRRCIGMLADYGLMTVAMIRMGEPLGWVYVILMWVTVGNGLRYGNRYLVGAVVAAFVGFGAVVVGNDYWWLANRSLGIGLLLGLVAIPLYLSGLLRDLTRATREARRASEAKSRFLANMSHEFRTPLNGLAGMSELLSTTELDSEQRECLDTIQASTRSLLSLVEDVLDISAIEAGKVKLKFIAFDVRELVEGIGLILQPQARSKQLRYVATVAPEVPDAVCGDDVHLRQVLVNMAGNAIKFTDHGSVRFDVALIEQDSHRVRLRFTVTDTGIGVPMAIRNRLFEAFEQADASLGRRYGGTGLGTTIAKGLAEAMGGSIGFESTEQRGSRFWVEVPFDRVAAAPVASGTGASGGTAPADPATESPENVIAFSDPFLRHRARVRSLQVLVADDHAANRMVLQRLLQKAGHRVTCVDDGEGVLAALDVSDYDVVIADLHMPRLSGLDLLRQLRVMEAGGGRRTPVLMLSADVTPESIQACEQAGARAFMAKPVSIKRMLDTLAEIALNVRIVEPAASRAPAIAPVRVEGVFDAGVLDELAALGMGDNFEREFITQCLGDAEACISALAEAGESGGWDLLRDQAHALKGVASNLGLVKLASASSEVMGLADWQLANEWRRRLGNLGDGLAQGRMALDARDRAKNARGERSP
ncbi:ATP-binding protein [Lysobacter sp. F6437]|uniref:ATP-binding protein n=1 Tax=Lysobacter sp. F6437 TaxID=3459296 RepID=UPI00403D9071